MVGLKGRFTGESLFNELNECIRNIISIFNSSREKHGDYWAYKLNFDLRMQHQDYLDILLSILYEKSTLKNDLDEKRCSIEIFNFNRIIEEIAQYKDDAKLYVYFLNELEEALKSITIDEYRFVFVLNITFDNHENISKDFLQPFGLKRFNKQNYAEIKNKKSIYDKYSHLKDFNIDFKEVIEVFDRYPGEIYEIKIEAGDSFFAAQEAKFKLESFIGFLSFATNLYKKSTILGGSVDIAKSEELNKDYTICPFKSKFYTIIRNDTVFQNIAQNELDLLEWNIKIHKINNISLIQDIFQIIADHKMFEEICEKFCLYFSASTENRLDYSFLKFWIISEQIIKGHGNKTDQQMLKLIAKLHDDDALKKRSDFLIKKRNYLVHEGKVGNISQSDRNLSKILADIVLRAYIASMRIVDTTQDFDFVIKNMRIGKTQLNKQINLLNDLISEEN